MVALADVNYNFKGATTSAQVPLVFGIGAQYACIGKDALKVTAGGSGARAITIATAPNGVWGDGVLSIWNSATNLNVAVVSSGTRYDTLVIRRTWQPASTPTGTAQLMLLTGGSSKTIAASRTTNRGMTTSDQPIALIRCSAGQGTIVASDITDLRCWAGQGGGLSAGSVEALQYLGELGTQVRVGQVQYQRLMDTTGALYWASSGGERPFVQVGRTAPFSSPITATSLPLYAGQGTTTAGAWAEHFTTSLGGASQAAAPANPAKITILTPGWYAVKLIVSVIVDVGTVFALSLETPGPGTFSHSRTFILADQRHTVPLVDYAYLPAGSVIQPSWGSLQPFTPQMWQLSATRVSD